MKVAITSTGSDLDSMVDERFGRCRYFIFVDPDTEEFEAMENEYTGGTHGTGVQVAQFIVDKGVSALITGNVGPNAMRVLTESGIKVFTTNSMSVREAVEYYREGKLSMASGPTTTPHM
ncbi:NifB/NifX family molybdenum-iron cluster-binding protein [Thermoanaerobacterium sp. DL9XJH110]|uniref:NifB/NifX family molybdenum-iron cluster-binding protein n=1 Tax=Thermoanaerobacterium sp. DL9XJH110 TaxID=3386643 RepID=UPI003BB50D76